MSECLVTQLLIGPQAAAATQPTVAVEEADAGFTLGEELPEEPADAPGHEGPAAEVPVHDPLQLLIEDLSGITGSLRDAIPQAAEETQVAVPSTDLMAPRTASPDGLPVMPEGVRLDIPQAEPAPADLVAVEPPTLDAEPLLAEAVAAQAPSLPQVEAASPGTMRPVKAAVPPPVAHQIAEAVVTTRDSVVEIALAPEELGRLRMVVTGPEQSPHVMIWVERPDVLEQLRRNSAFLQECFGDAGMPEASFEFGGDTPSGSHDGRPSPSRMDHAVSDGSAQMRVVPVAWSPIAVPARLDIRI